MIYKVKIVYTIWELNRVLNKPHVISKCPDGDAYKNLCAAVANRNGIIIM